MTTLLPVISSNIASLNLKLVASTSWLRKLMPSEIGAVQKQGCSNLRGRCRRSHSASRSRGAIAHAMSSLASGAQEQVVVKAMGKPVAPVLLLDVMGTLVRDPFYEDIPSFFEMTMKELQAAKHPTAWVEFECGQLTEEDLQKKFFADGRDFDIQGLKECMSKGYVYLEGVEELLQRLLSAGYSMHAFSNYPCWYTMIEDKLQLSQYMPWTFISCHMGVRKPEAEIYLEAARQLKLDPSSCVFVDDRRKNVEAAVAVGMRGIVFQNATQLEEELVALGCSL